MRIIGAAETERFIMSIFDVFTLCGGLAFFLYGMHVMSTGLEKMMGGRLEKILKKMTSNPFKSLALGAGITIAIQSSSAMTVMLVGLVNSGIMELGQTIGVIMGSNIGTTLTAWLLSLTGIEDGNFFVKLLKPSSFSPIIALIGIIMLMACKSGRKKDVGNIFVGFAVLMTGMQLMSGAVSPLSESESFVDILTMFSNPVFGVLVGAVFTGIIQSSAASVGILQALSLTGSLTWSMSIPIIMGQNIGTCVTSLLSSIGANKNAKRVVAVHMLFNIIGTAFLLVVVYGLNVFIDFEFLEDTINPAGIALVHSIFNVTTTALLFPFTKQLEKLAKLIVRDKKSADSEEKYEFLDERLLATPSFAIAECKHLTVNMAKVARDTMLSSIEMLDDYDAETAELIVENEDLIDKYEDKLGSFLVKLSSKQLTDSDSREISKLLHSIGDFERISDHAVNVLKVAQEMNTKGLSFSEQGQGELDVLTQALRNILILTTDAFIGDNIQLAAKVEPLEQVIDGLKAEMKDRHIRRLQMGACTIELGFILSDLLTNYGRVSDHCSNIAVCTMQMHSADFDMHSFLDNSYNQPEYIAAFDSYKLEYVLPR